MHSGGSKVLRCMFAPFVAMCIVAAMIGSAATGATAPSLHGVIRGNPIWDSYKSRFTNRQGRVIDNANGNITHSEGQGFGMLMAVAADDPAAFHAMWNFTSSQLGIRRDNLLAWKWRPTVLRKVPDKNNATDGDILVAWALLEAAEAGFGRTYRNKAFAILHDVKKLIKADDVFGRFLMPAKFGFGAHQHKGKYIINLSYWVFPAFERITELTGDKSWRSLSKSGERLLEKASRNRAGLPADWNTLKRHSGIVGTTKKFTETFSYNAVRLPLYLAWSRTGSYPKLAAFQKNWVQRSADLHQINVRTNRHDGAFRENGYRAIAAVVNCSISGTRFPDHLRRKIGKIYYPASLQILSIIAVKQRYPKCW